MFLDHSVILPILGDGVMAPVCLAMQYNAMDATILVIAIASTSLTCYLLCCRSTNQGTLHYDPKNLPTIQDLKAHSSTLVHVKLIKSKKSVGRYKLFFQLLSDSANTPTYHDVVSSPTHLLLEVRRGNYLTKI